MTTAPDWTATPFTGSDRGGRGTVLRVGAWSARATFALAVAYAAAMVASGAATGAPRDPYWAIAEVLVIAMALVLVALMLALHEYAAPARKPLATAALGAVLATATLTITVHFVELSLARHDQLAADSELAWVFSFTWPSLLYGVEIVAWNFFFGAALVCASGLFAGHHSGRTVRIGLAVAGLLTLAGLIGPAVGGADWRVIGVLGYGVVFPLVCLLIGRVLVGAAADRDGPDPRRRDVRSPGESAPRDLHSTQPDSARVSADNGRRAGHLVGESLGGRQERPR